MIPALALATLTAAAGYLTRWWQDTTRYRRIIRRALVSSEHKPMAALERRVPRETPGDLGRRQHSRHPVPRETDVQLRRDQQAWITTAALRRGWTTEHTLHEVLVRGLTALPPEPDTRGAARPREILATLGWAALALLFLAAGGWGLINNLGGIR